MFQGKHVSVIIAAAGSARRMRGIDKIFMKLGDRPVLAQVVKNFEDHPSVDEIVIAVREDQVPRCGQLAEEYVWQKVTGEAALPDGRQALYLTWKGTGSPRLKKIGFLAV